MNDFDTVKTLQENFVVNFPPWDGANEEKASASLTAFIRKNSADLEKRYGIDGIDAWPAELQRVIARHGPCGSLVRLVGRV